MFAVGGLLEHLAGHFVIGENRRCVKFVAEVFLESRGRDCFAGARMFNNFGNGDVIDALGGQFRNKDSLLFCRDILGSALSFFCRHGWTNNLSGKGRSGLKTQFLERNFVACFGGCSQGPKSLATLASLVGCRLGKHPTRLKPGGVASRGLCC